MRAGVLDSQVEGVATKVVDAAVAVHRVLGPGLLESAYQACLCRELELAGLEVRCEVQQPVRYKDVLIDAGYRLDMLVEDVVIIENKAVDRVLPIHEAQLLTYLKLSSCELGFLMNWNVRLMKDGIKRYVLTNEDKAR